MKRTNWQRSRISAARLALIPTLVVLAITAIISINTGQWVWVSISVGVFGISYLIAQPIAYSLYALASDNSEEQMRGAVVAIGGLTAILMAIAGISAIKKANTEKQRKDAEARWYAQQRDAKAYKEQQKQKELQEKQLREQRERQPRQQQTQPVSSQPRNYDDEREQQRQEQERLKELDRQISHAEAHGDNL